MLERLLSSLREASGPISVDDLSNRLQVERSALQPMLDLLVRKGLLTEGTDVDTDVACCGGACATSCTGIQGCPFVAGGMPRTLEIRSNN
ncbi:MAG: FeoC-like transcriptional regulator [Acidimicrobiia bacterium]|nr:FeoC-like transcriptional regulator [Acidimicrobiia bacterium]MDH3397213.1 FeoC-like transcriptional regulator [Acidimicrobiia bacterium]